MAEQTAARPDLAPLLETDRALYTRVVLVMIGGATWQPGNGYCWLTGGDVRGVYSYRPGSLGNHAVLPDPENDPAAAWSLMERERVVPVPYRKAWAGVAVYHSWPTVQGWEVDGDHVRPQATPARAVTLAVLTKHADGEHADLIRPLLEG